MLFFNMYLSSISMGVTLFLTSATAQRLTKPPLQPNLDNLKQGLLSNLHPTHSTMDQWGAGWIASWCKDTAKTEGFNPADIQTWNIHYDDVLQFPSPSLLIILIDILNSAPTLGSSATTRTAPTL